MLTFTDQLNRRIQLARLPRRIVSLVPSQTELLADLGLDQEVVGITKFCIHPDQWFRSKTRVGGTKDIHADRIAALQPELIIANKEENIKEQIESLSLHYPLWISDVHDLGSALQMIQSLGELTASQPKAQQITSQINLSFTTLPRVETRLRVAYLIWKNPYMTVGGDTFIHDMLTRCGFSIVFAGSLRYPVTSVEELKRKQCDLIFLSSEPYPFKEKDISELRNELPETRIRLVDGEYFSWYGSRLLKAAHYFKSLIPECSVI
jgi:ABC-type Fe3+-hydroxamate transport system substrate-binding protein